MNLEKVRILGKDETKQRLVTLHLLLMCPQELVGQKESFTLVTLPSPSTGPLSGSRFIIQRVLFLIHYV